MRDSRTTGERIRRPAGRHPMGRASREVATMRNLCWMVAVAAPVVAAVPGAQAGSPGGIGVLGDSYSDEYRFYPPDRSAARNWVEILAEHRGLDFGPYA